MFAASAPHGQLQQFSSVWCAPFVTVQVVYGAGIREGPGVPRNAALTAGINSTGVTVQHPRGVQIKDGGGLPRSTASLATTKNSNSDRPCCRQVATTVSSRSANRLPASLSDP